MKPELVKLMSLNGSRQRYYACLTALALRSGANGVAHFYIGMFDCDLRFLKLVVEACEGSANFEPTTVRRRIIEAWSVAYHRAGRRPGGIDPFRFPTLNQVKKEFEDRYPNAKIPGDETFRRAFRELKLGIHRQKAGRRKGIKDSRKRKRRKYRLQKRALHAL